jgi:hypothetical protein
MVAIYANFGTLNFYEVEVNGVLQEGFIERVGEIVGLSFGPAWQPIFVTTGISFLLLIGATGKSAQIPLFVWLPDAMAGPTPVSALIHAATMVTGGVYLMTRTETLFQASPATQAWVMWIGGLTAVLAATAAVAQWDIKRVLAYSTVSQLGFMVAACGMGAYAAAIFHLLTHGVFKALLFLGSGSVIHGTHETQDMRKMGGLREHMPQTFRTYLIGSLALAGVVPLAGFWSKDEILAHAWSHNHTAIFILLLFASLMTAFYMGRQVALVFYGEQRDPSYHAHESGQVMTVPLLILAGGAVVAGLMNLPGFFEGMPGAHLLTDWLKPVLHEEAGKFNPFLAVLATIIAVGMGYGGWRLYKQCRAAAQGRRARSALSLLGRYLGDARRGLVCRSLLHAHDCGRLPWTRVVPGAGLRPTGCGWIGGRVGALHRLGGERLARGAERLRPNLRAGLHGRGGTGARVYGAGGVIRRGTRQIAPGRRYDWISNTFTGALAAGAGCAAAAGRAPRQRRVGAARSAGFRAAGVRRLAGAAALVLGRPRSCDGAQHRAADAVSRVARLVALLGCQL